VPAVLAHAGAPSVMAVLNPISGPLLQAVGCGMVGLTGISGGEVGGIPSGSEGGGTFSGPGEGTPIGSGSGVSPGAGGRAGPGFGSAGVGSG